MARECRKHQSTVLPAVQSAHKICLLFMKHCLRIFFSTPLVRVHASLTACVPAFPTLAPSVMVTNAQGDPYPGQYGRSGLGSLEPLT